MVVQIEQEQVRRLHHDIHLHHHRIACVKLKQVGGVEVREEVVLGRLGAFHLWDAVCCGERTTIGHIEHRILVLRLERTIGTTEDVVVGGAVQAVVVQQAWR